MEKEIKTIRGGWKNVPAGLHTKTHLKNLGLKPTGDPVGEVWQGRRWVLLYDEKETVKRKKPTEKQLAALEKAKEKRKENLTCVECKKIQKHEIHMEYHNNERLCMNCYEERISTEHLKELKEQKRRKREEAIQDFQKWNKEDFVILDTETTGLDFAEVVEIAVGDRNGNILFHSLVNPEGRIQEEATQIHGLSKGDLSDSPAFSEIWEEVYSILKDKKILFYNEDFHAGAILRSFHGSDGVKDFLKLDKACVQMAYSSALEFDGFLSRSEASGFETECRSIPHVLVTLTILQKAFAQFVS